MNTALRLREFTLGDGESCRRLFNDTVRQVNCRDYTPTQIDAWAHAAMNVESWLRRFSDNFALVVEQSDAIVGFADMTRDGYLDRLFVSADHQRQGIATMLMNAIESAAKNSHLSRVHTQASITAKPFFVSRGFTVVAEQTVKCRGIELTNFVMELKLEN